MYICSTPVNVSFGNNRNEKLKFWYVLSPSVGYFPSKYSEAPTVTGIVISGTWQDVEPLQRFAGPGTRAYTNTAQIHARHPVARW